jgi:DNA polymerase I
MIVLDIETNLAHDTIWCVAVKVDDAPTKILIASDYPLLGNPIKELQELIDTTTGHIVAHNGIGFDFPVLESVWGIRIPEHRQHDTLVVSRLLSPMRDGGHGLKSWGIRLGFEKMDFDVEDFDSGYTNEMGVYCKRDVDVNYKLYHHLVEQQDKLKFSDESVQLEHDVARITRQQERNGFKLDFALAVQWQTDMINRMTAIENDLQQRFPPIVTERYSEKTGKRLKDDVEVFNVGSRQQIAKRLSSLGVKFNKYTPTGVPVINEDTLSSIDKEEAQLCAEYLQLVKLNGMVTSWIDSCDATTHRIHGRVNTCGAVTGRMTHSSPNLAQIPSLKIARECFTVDEGNVLVGCDASGLELRCLAHYMQDPKYTEQILEGDIHTYNQLAAGLPERNMAKTMIYGLIYGAGDAKLGKIVDGSAKDGKRIRDTFLRKTPALKRLIDKVKGIAERNKSVPALDGRRVWVDEDYKSLNRLLQSCGAIVMKKAVVLAHQRLKQNNIPFMLVAQVHDEFQFETPQAYGKAVGMIARQAIIDAGEYFNMRCPQDGEFKIGANWSETH